VRGRRKRTRHSRSDRCLAALTISDIPFNGPIVGVKIGMMDGDFIINPTHEQIEQAILNLWSRAAKKAC
jgi:polyribonucleotide nucleotidyltransferase